MRHTTSTATWVGLIVSVLVLVVGLALSGLAHTLNHGHLYGNHLLATDTSYTAHETRTSCVNGSWNWDTKTERHYHYERINSLAPWYYTHTTISQQATGFGLC